jgi:hypothetical protein
MILRIIISIFLFFLIILLNTFSSLTINIFIGLVEGIYKINLIWGVVDDSGGFPYRIVGKFKKIFQRPFSGRESRLILVAEPGWEIGEKQPYTPFWEDEV